MTESANHTTCHPGLEPGSRRFICAQPWNSNYSPLAPGCRIKSGMTFLCSLWQNKKMTNEPISKTTQIALTPYFLSSNASGLKSFLEKNEPKRTHFINMNVNPVIPSKLIRLILSEIEQLGVVWAHFGVLMDKFGVILDKVGSIKPPKILIFSMKTT